MVIHHKFIKRKWIVRSCVKNGLAKSGERYFFIEFFIYFTELRTLFLPKWDYTKKNVVLGLIKY